jgi:hypothetical protein
MTVTSIHLSVKLLFSTALLRVQSPGAAAASRQWFRGIYLYSVVLQGTASSEKEEGENGLRALHRPHSMLSSGNSKPYNHKA